MADFSLFNDVVKAGTMTCPRPPTSPNRGKREGRRRKARVHPNTLWTSDARLLPIRTHEDERRISSAADTSTPRWLDEAFLFALQRANVAQGGHAFWQDPVPSLRCPSRARPTLRGLLRALPSVSVPPRITSVPPLSTSYHLRITSTRLQRRSSHSTITHTNVW